MIYFASDFHLGLPNRELSLPREKKIIEWLDKIKSDATNIFLLGDIFEFWYEWKYVIPKHFARFFGKIAELSDTGVKIHFFTGNHDLWIYDYFTKEFGVKIYYEPQTFIFNEKKFYLAHGDGLGPSDKPYKAMKKVFKNRFMQWLFSNFVHPDKAYKMAMKISFRLDSLNKKPVFKGDNEWLVQHSVQLNKNEKHDFYIYGHRHIPVEQIIDNNSKVIFLGDWIKHFTYAIFDGNETMLKNFNS